MNFYHRWRNIGNNTEDDYFLASHLTNGIDAGLEAMRNL
jgi:hypothetical protein